MAENAEEEKQGCRMNKFQVEQGRNRRYNLQRDGDKMLELLPEGERGGGDVLLTGDVAGRLILFKGIAPLMAPTSHS
jgi:hypothetical protein